MKKTTIALLALTLTLGLATSAFAWHGGGHGGGHNGGWHSNEHRGSYVANKNIPYEMHGGGHEYAADNTAIHEKEMKDPNHSDTMLDYTAPHKKGANCDGMTGPHGRHLLDK